MLLVKLATRAGALLPRLATRTVPRSYPAYTACAVSSPSSLRNASRSPATSRSFASPPSTPAASSPEHKFILANTLLASNDASQQQEMLRLLTEAAEEGSADAQVTLGHLLLVGHQPAGLKPDPAKAFEWTLKSGEQGNIGAQCRLAVMCASGTGTPPDEKSAFEWTLRAAENDANSPEAKAALGVMYYQGRGCDASHERAFTWTLRAADAGLLEAQGLAGDMFYHGLGTDVDMKRAYVYTKMAAMQGHKFSQLKVASMCLMGEGTKADVDVAKEWAKKATGQEIDFVDPGQWLHDRMREMMEEEVKSHGGQ